ncbi:antibiotic biosynthesis monooxygenase family protein [Amycolatopsis rhabdoformis]|uniref:Antibiotic biosynthesis monooxygenase family protein n=1 Tax=Amycolatopsis rhabdoformis TaxID=1448059 RepID=A0ABZ1I8T1_9PSEU|nr:antibiotic biosynthesis monooxygenase family protein [Amycolatopsis rhabdoformis]WSE30116.1 antibiotic biosynthesis monooxygenase family protein [Amycolatopsis rhabdoformis]
MTQIDPTADLITLINVFTVDPAHQQELVDVLVSATEHHIRHREGFISANIHTSTDGTRVLNYAQWTDVAHFEAMLADPACRPHLAAAAALATYDPHLYTVTSTHHR